MSKVERLNARVAKLLTVAVHEVLEVVRETVSEYQEKTARTQRENERLRRRLQELQQDKQTRESAGAEQGVGASPEPRERLPTRPVHCKQELAFSLQLDADPSRAAEDQRLAEWPSPERLYKPDASPTLPRTPPPHPPLCLRKESGPSSAEERAEGEGQRHGGATRELNEQRGATVSRQEAGAGSDAFVEEHHSPGQNYVSQSAAALSELRPHHHVADGRGRDPDSVAVSYALSPNSLSPLATQPRLAIDEIKTEAETDACEPYVAQRLLHNAAVVSGGNGALSELVPEPRLADPGACGLLYCAHAHAHPAGRDGLGDRLAFEENVRAALEGRSHEPLGGALYRKGGGAGGGGGLRFLQRHHHLHHKAEKRYCCGLCGRAFSHAGDFKKHKRVHTGEKPYCCPVCGKRFSQSGYLKIHQRYHTGERPYACAQCGKSFSHSSNFKKHQQTHAGQRA